MTSSLTGFTYMTKGPNNKLVVSISILKAIARLLLREPAFSLTQTLAGLNHFDPVVAGQYIGATQSFLTQEGLFLTQ